MRKIFKALSISTLLLCASMAFAKDIDDIIKPGNDLLLAFNTSKFVKQLPVTIDNANENVIRIRLAKGSGLVDDLKNGEPVSLAKQNSPNDYYVFAARVNASGKGMMREFDVKHVARHVRKVSDKTVTYDTEYYNVKDGNLKLINKKHLKFKKD